MRGLVEKTRVTVVEVAGKGGGLNHDNGDSTTEDLTTDTEDDIMEDLDAEGNHGRWEMEIARVYERTIVELGDALDISGRANSA